MDYREVCTAGDLLIRGATLAPDRDALVFPDDRRTYAGLLGRAVAEASSLHGLGVRRGDRVGILMPNSLRYLDVWFGAMLLGAVIVPINGRFRSRELRHVVPDAGIRVMVVADVEGLSYTERLTAAFPALAGAADPAEGARLDLDGVPDLRYVVDLSSTGRPGFLPADRWDAVRRDVDPQIIEEAASCVGVRDPATIFYTSGTTALPKGCVLSHEAMVRQGQETADRMDVRDGDVMYNPLPMFHTACSQPLFTTLWALGTYCTLPVPEADAGIEMMKREGATVLYTAFPPITEALANHPDAHAAFAGVRSILAIGAEAQLRDLERRLPGTKVVSSFGMTEVAGSVSIADPRDPIELRLVSGRPLRGAEIEVRDIGHGGAAPTGVEGEIVVRSPTLFSGYHNMPDTTSEVLDEEGWYHTGDLGLIDERGLLHFRGRLKDMLKIGGENVAAIEIESHIMSHPAVAHAAVVGAPDDRLGQVPCVYVELRPGAEATEQEIIDWCTGEIASFKVPRYVRFIEEWPMSATKIRKVDLRERIVEEIGRA